MPFYRVDQFNRTFFPQSYNNNNKNALSRVSRYRMTGGYQKKKKKTDAGYVGRVSVYVAVVQLDTILSNSNAATTKKRRTKRRTNCWVTNNKTAKIPEKHTCALAQTKVFRQCKPEVSANPRKGMKKKN